MIPQTDLFYCIRINSPSLNNTTKNIRELDKWLGAVWQKAKNEKIYKNKIGTCVLMDNSVMDFFEVFFIFDGDKWLLKLFKTWISLKNASQTGNQVTSTDKLY